VRGEDGVVEVPKHGGLVGRRHRPVVVRAQPALVLRFVTRAADLAADEGCDPGFGRRRRLPLPEHPNRRDKNDHRGRSKPDTLPPQQWVRGHDRTTWESENDCRRMGLLISTLTMSFSMRTAKRSSGRGAGGLRTWPVMSKAEA